MFGANINVFVGNMVSVITELKQDKQHRLYSTKPFTKAYKLLHLLPFNIAIRWTSERH